MKRIPRATYRLQLHADFTFQDAAKVVPYLYQLGISDLYISPPFQAVSGSTHGYNLVSYQALNTELGGETGFLALSNALKAHDMGLIVDFVPNHMGIALGENPWWEDVLEHGQGSRYAKFFDIEWQPLKRSLEGKVLLPVLGDQYGRVLERGELKLEMRVGRSFVRYFERYFPISQQLSEQQIQAFNQDIDQLDTLLQQQHYRLAYWKVASQEINYRRFFDINDLVALRMEEPEVFQETHKLLFRLIEEGHITGVRLDHTDGLYDPLGYFKALETHCNYILAEKILEPGEALPERWPIQGTTGYDFLAQLGGLWVRQASEEEFTAIYRRFTGNTLPYPELLYQGKRQIMQTSLASEINVLAAQLERLAESDRRSRDFTLTALRSAIIETIACFPVYRTYIRPDGSREPADHQHIQRAIRLAKRRARGVSQATFDFLAEVLQNGEFALQFQQFTGPVMAKGAEDTAFYNYNRLISLCEVGSDPGVFGVSLEDFHQEASKRARHWPHSMLATSTHDTKRGEDTRARISVLSEMPQSWMAYLSAWSKLAWPFTCDLEGERAPDLSDEYLFYQTVLGSWPLDQNFTGYSERICEYLIKALREAKRNSSWTDPNSEYEEATLRFAQQMLAEPEFIASMQELHERISPHAAQSGLSAALIKCTAPGVPDIYQGSEVWNQSLVDPDNRRPVDYQQLAQLLDSSLESYTSGALKLFVIQRALELRREQPELFESGEYLPLEAGEHLVAFARVLGEQVAITLAPRLTLTQGAQPWALGEIWGDLELSFPGTFRNILTGELHTSLKLREIFVTLPLALLVRI